MKRLIMTLSAIALTMILAVCTVYADAKDSAEKELLSALGIVSEEELLRDGVTTRAEFVVYTLRMANYTATSGANAPQFTDVAKSYWAYNEISTAYSLGMIKPKIGGGFEPDSPIMATDAARMLLCAIGYGDYVKNMSDSNVLRLADSVKLFDGTVKSVGVPLERESVFKLIFNAMSIDMPFLGGVKADGTPEYHLKKGVNILSEKYRIYYSEGIVTADSNSVISGDAAGIGDVIIGGVRYSMSASDTDKWIGMNVGLWWRDNDISKEILVIYDEKNNISEIGFENAEFSGNAFVELSDERRINRRINAKSTILINGSLVSDSSQINETLKDYAGSIKMIDNNRDNVYDVIILKRYINVRVDSYNDIDNILMTQNVPGERDEGGNILPPGEYKLDDYEEVVIKDCFLDVIEPSQIKVDDILSLYVPLSKEKRFEIIKGADSFSSELISANTADERERFIVCDDDNTYPLSLSCLIDWDKIIIGEDYTFYPDWTGAIVFIDMKVQDLKMGYLRRAYAKEGTDTIQFNIFTSGGVMLTYDLKDTVAVRKADGSTARYSGEELIERVLPESCDTYSMDYTTDANGVKYDADGDAREGNVKQPIMYKLTRDDKISKIWVLTDNQELLFHTLTDDLSKKKVNSEGVKENYRFEYRTNNFMGKYLCTADTRVFVVPRRGNSETDYKIGSTGLFTAGTYVHFHNQRQRLYMIAIQPDSFITDAIIYKIDYNMSKGVKTTSTPLVYYKKIDTVNSDGDQVAKIFLMADDGSEKTYEILTDDGIVRDTTGSQINYGDIVRIDVDEKGNVSPSTIHRMYDCVENKHFQYLGDTSAVRYLSSVRVVPVQVTARQGNYIKFDTVYGTAPDASKTGDSSEVASVASARVYVFDKKNNTITETSPARITSGDTFVMNVSLGTPKLIVYYK